MAGLPVDFDGDGAEADMPRAAGDRKIASSPRGVALAVTAAYLVGGGLWILLSDRFLEKLLARDESADALTRLQTYKGWYFVAVTGLLLYAMVHWGGRRIRSGQRAVERSESLFRGVVESNAVAIFVYHHAGRILRANDAFLELVGYTRSDLNATLLNWREMTPEEFHGRAGDACHQAVSRAGRSDPYEMHFIRKDGRRIPMMVTLAPLPGDPGFGVAAIVDLTERKRREERAAELNRELEAAGRLKDEFLAMLSHELRTPITAIRLWADLLRVDGGRDPELTEEALVNIDQGVEAQTQLINDLLDVSRIASGQLRVERLPTDLRPVVRAAVEAIAPSASEHGITLVTRLGDEGAERVAAQLIVSGDAGRLRQVACNLLANAIKFTPRGGTITVDLYRTQHIAGTVDRATLSVTDTGEGLRPEFLHHLFEPFRQSDSSTTRRHGGLGIGLSIARRLVEMHDGTIRAESAGQGQGSRFVVDLPLAPVPATKTGPALPRQEMDARAVDTLSRIAPAAATASQSPASPAVTAPPLEGVRVLVVDDHAETRRAVTRLLKSLGADVDDAPSAAAALNLARAARPRVLVSDIGMPEQDGYDLIRSLRTEEASAGNGSHPKLHAIALTAFAMPEDCDKALAAGFDEYLSKPVNFGELLEKVKTGARGTASAAVNA